MGDLSANLSRHEFACPCGCGETPVDFDLPEVIQGCIDHFVSIEYGHRENFQRVACTITSGYRCAEYNASVDGASPTSKHILGMAADHRMECVFNDGSRTPISDDEIADYYELRYPNQYGIGRYIGRTHIDTRQAPARWDAR